MRSNRATRKGIELRKKLDLLGQVDAEAVANLLGLTVVPLTLEVLQELTVDDCIGVAQRLNAAWRRWVIAHAIGHKVLHPGNHLWMRTHTCLATKIEREAEDFALAFLVSLQEVIGANLAGSSEIAEYFGVPEEMILIQAPLFTGCDLDGYRR